MSGTFACPGHKFPLFMSKDRHPDHFARPVLETRQPIHFFVQLEYHLLPQHRTSLSAVFRYACNGEGAAGEEKGKNRRREGAHEEEGRERILDLRRERVERVRERERLGPRVNRITVWNRNERGFGKRTENGTSSGYSFWILRFSLSLSLLPEVVLLSFLLLPRSRSFSCCLILIFQIRVHGGGGKTAAIPPPSSSPRLVFCPLAIKEKKWEAEWKVGRIVWFSNSLFPSRLLFFLCECGCWRRNDSVQKKEKENEDKHIS